MMSKSILLLAISLCLFPQLVSGQGCLSSWEITSASGCSYESLSSQLQGLLGSCGHNALTELQLILGETFEAGVQQKIAEICGAEHLPFSAISTKGHVFDKAYYDGDTDWNSQRQAKDQYGITVNVLENDPGARIKDIYQTIAQSNGITWPGEYMINFESCALRSAMCCFVQDRQAGDDNGNCVTPYDEGCLDADPADNTDICYLDMANSPTSGRTPGGWAIFKDEKEGDAHCHGFAWSEDATHSSARYKANNLFYISMYDHLYQRGYVKNLPGAPLCGCVEQMPVVSRSDCTQIDIVNEDATFSYTSQAGLVASITNLEIDFNSCQGANNKNNNLAAHYQKLVNEGEATQTEKVMLDQIIVGDDNCEAAIYNFLDSQGLQEKPPSFEGYVMNPIEQTWEWHSINAQIQGCQLASVGSEADNQDVLAAAQSFGSGSSITLWIGGSHVSQNVFDPLDGSAATWEWSDGSAWSFTKWAGGQHAQPNGADGDQDAVVIMTASAWSGTSAGDWQDKTGTESHPAVYECPQSTRTRRFLR